MSSSVDTIDALIKIEYLVAAAQYLTANEEERHIQSELLSIVQETAMKAQEVTSAESNTSATATPLTETKK